MFTAADVISHPVYDEVIQKMLGSIQQSGEPVDIVEVIFSAANDGRDQLRYPAGRASQKIYSRRLEIGPEASRVETTKWFLSL